MLVLPSSRFFLLSPIFSLAAVVPFRLVFNFSLRTRFSISRFVLRFFDFVRSFVLWMPFPRPGCWYSFFPCAFLPSRFLKLHFIFIACSVSANVVVLFFLPKRTLRFFLARIPTCSPRLFVLAFSFWFSSFLEISCLLSPLRGSRTMLLVVISCNSTLCLYFLALLFFAINFSISLHFSFSIFRSRLIFSIRVVQSGAPLFSSVLSRRFLL